MSSLLKLKQPIRQSTVMVSDEEGFSVRGITPNQVMSIYYRHAGLMGAVFDRVISAVSAGASPERNDVESIVMGLAADAPLLLAEIITLASGGSPADEADAIDADGNPLGITQWQYALTVAASLPFPVQVDAIHKIGDLTFTSDMPVGKFAALVLKTAGRLTGAMKPNSPEA